MKMRDLLPKKRARRDATLLFWINSARYGFTLLPHLTRDEDEHATILDARWLCFGVNLALVDEKHERSTF